MKKTSRKLTAFLEDVLNKVDNIRFGLRELENDKDINFFVSTEKQYHGLGNDYNFSFIMYCSNEKSLSIYCPTLYRIKDNDSAMYTLNAINAVNSRIAIGRYT